MKHLLKTISVSAILLGAASVYAEPHSFNNLSYKQDNAVTAQKDVSRIVYTTGQGKYRPYHVNSHQPTVKENTDIVSSNASRHYKRFDRNI